MGSEGAKRRALRCIMYLHGVVIFLVREGPLDLRVE